MFFFLLVDTNSQKPEPQTSKKVERRGRKAVLDHEALKKFCDENITKFYDSDGNIAQFTWPIIIDELHQALQEQSTSSLAITKQAVYLAVKRHFKNYTIPNQNTESDSDTEYTGVDNFEINNSDLKFDSELECAEFLNHTRKSKWDFKLFEKVWLTTKVPCHWRFGKHNNTMPEVNIVGTCAIDSCNAKILVQTSAQRTRLQIFIKDFDNEIKHIGKRRCFYPNKGVLDEARFVGAAAARKNRAAEIMNDGDVEPPHLPSQGSQLYKNQKSNDLHENRVISLRLMKDQAEYRGKIGDIGLDPFYLHYSLPIQREWAMNQIFKHRFEISLDATGLNVSKPKFTSVTADGKEKAIFLYVT